MILCFILTSCSDTCVFLETGGWSDSFHMARKGGRKQSRNILHMYCILGGKNLGTGKILFYFHTSPIVKKGGRCQANLTFWMFLPIDLCLTRELHTSYLLARVYPGSQWKVPTHVFSRASPWGEENMRIYPYFDGAWVTSRSFLHHCKNLQKRG